MGLFSGISHALGFGSAQGANTSYVDPAQISQAYKNTQTGLQQQQELLKALQAQNGIQNQSSVFQQQQDLANALNQQAQGQGPNPAQQALANQTGQNVQQQAALMAGQRGAGANAGLIARQAGQQGAGIQQQAVGQSALLQAQQQLAAQGQLQQQQQSMAGLSTQQVGQQQGAANAYQQGSLQQQGNLLGAQAQQNNAAIQNQGLENQGIGAILGGLGAAGGAFAAGGGKGKWSGGEIAPHIDQIARIYHPHMYSGGEVETAVSPGEVYLDPSETKEVAAGANPLKVGEKFKGKAVVQGDSPKNDILQRDLQAGGMVIPRTVVNSGSEEEAKNFVAQHLRENNHHEDFHEALKRAIQTRIKK